jgi:hypothetical protein
VNGGSVLTVVSAETGAAVPGARVNLGQGVVETNGSGQVTLDPALRLDAQSPLDIVAGGFLDRNTRVRSADGATFSLWPKTSPTGLDEALTTALVYRRALCPMPGGSLPPDFPLQRPAAGTATVVLAPALAGEAAVTAHGSAITQLNGLLAGSLTYTLAPQRPAGGGYVIEIQVDPGDPNCPGPEPFRAVTYLNSDGADTVVSGRIVYCSAGAAGLFDLVLHELGHTTGLRHSPSQSDVMYCSSGRPASYSAREALVLRLMYQRRAGTVFPDNDRGAAGAQARSRTSVLACSAGS